MNLLEIFDSDKVAYDFQEEKLTFREALKEIKAYYTLFRSDPFANKSEVYVEASASRHFVSSLWGCLLAGKTFIPVENSNGISSRQAICVPGMQKNFLNIDIDLPTNLNTKESWIGVFSSGTTGVPKKVYLTGENVLSHIKSFQSANDCQDSDKWLCCLPLHHIGGLMILFRTLYFKQSVMFRSFDPQTFLVELSSGGVSFVSVVPTMLAKLDGQVIDSIESLKGVYVGGAFLSDSLRDKFSEWPIKNVYGSTETCSQIVENGKPLAGVEVDLDNSGKICVRAPQVSAHCLNEKGWYITNDLGELIDGKLRILGRADDIINSGGKKISPTIIENELRKYLPTPDFVVFGMPDKLWGEMVCVGILEDSIVNEDQFFSVVSNLKLESYQKPKRLVQLAEIPRDSLGKVNRSQVLKIARKKL